MRKLIILFMLSVLQLFTCATNQTKLRITTAVDADVIPRTIGVYPFLSAPITPTIKRYPQSRADDYMQQIKVKDEKIYITAPAESKLEVTPYSQMLTGFISVELANYGFDLRELPVEITDTNSSVGKKKNEFVISLALLQKLRDEYGLQAILIGNVYFVNDPYDKVAKKVSALYAKVIEIESLKVICQISKPFDEYGESMERVSAEIAAVLCNMVGL